MININYINILSEDLYIDTTWYKKIYAGISNELKANKEKIKNIKLSDVSSLSKDSVLIIIGFTEQLIQESIEICHKNNVRPLIVGFYSKSANSFSSSYVSVNREAAMLQNVSNLFDNGYKHIAIIGVNPSVYTDLSHLDGYKDACSIRGINDYQDDIFYNTTGIEDTVNKFLEVYKKYDAVVCTNDYVAIKLLSTFNELGVKVPEEISITGAGNTEVSALTNPSLTSIHIPLDEIGRQATVLYRILEENPKINSLYSICDFSIVYRNSTKIIEDSSHYNVNENDTYVPLEIIDYERAMRPIWNFADAYSQIDRVDRKIIYGIVCNLSNAEIADSVYISSSTLSYRLSKLYELTKTNGKDELRNLVNKYFPNYKA